MNVEESMATVAGGDPDFSLNQSSSGIRTSKDSGQDEELDFEEEDDDDGEINDDDGECKGEDETVDKTKTDGSIADADVVDGISCGKPAKLTEETAVPIVASSRDDDEDGEVNSDDDLEEGEVKEDNSDEGEDKKEDGPGSIKSICRFFSKGLCTWGPNCRFLHQKPNIPIKGPVRYGPPLPGNVGMPLPHHQRRGPPDNRRDYFFDHHAPHPPPHHQAPAIQGPPPPPPPNAPAVESAWERGLRNAKEMIVRATRRKEEEIDFDEKRFNLGVEDEATSHSRHSHHSRDSPSPPTSPPPRPRERNFPPHDRYGRIPAGDRHSGGGREEFWNPEYERRRRLAYESAPWNETHSPPYTSYNRNVPVPRSRDAAEEYRDPWRRSKSPTNRRPRRQGETSIGKRSHSMSSISGSYTGSDLSGSSFSNSSFSDSESNASEGAERDEVADDKGTSKGQTSSHHKSHPPEQEQSHHHHHHQKSSKQNRVEQIPANSGQQQQQRPKVSSKKSTTSGHDAKATSKMPPVDEHKRKAPVQPTRERKDSWSDSDSFSSKSMSVSRSRSRSASDSFFSGSPTGSDAVASDTENKQKGQKPVRSTTKSERMTTKPTAKKEAPKRQLSPSDHDFQAKRGKTSSATRVEKLTTKSRPAVKSPLSKSSTSRSPISPQPPLEASQPSQPEGPQKKPIKMTFMKKHSTIKKDMNVTAKLNGGHGSNSEEDEFDRISGADSPPLDQSPPSPSPSPPMEETARSPPPVLLSSQQAKNEVVPPTIPLTLQASQLTKEANAPADVKGQASRSGLGTTSSRREELLKQLKAVEDAIARKRAKLH